MITFDLQLSFRFTGTNFFAMMIHSKKNIQ